MCYLALPRVSDTDVIIVRNWTNTAWGGQYDDITVMVYQLGITGVPTWYTRRRGCASSMRRTGVVYD